MSDSKQPTARSWVAVAAHMRRADSDMGNKRGKGRTRSDKRSRGAVKRDLHNN